MGARTRRPSRTTQTKPSSNAEVGDKQRVRASFVMMFVSAVMPIFSAVSVGSATRTR